MTEINLDEVTEKDVTAIKEKNNRLVQGLAKQGVNIPDSLVLLTKLETFLELFLTIDQRYGLEYAFEAKMTPMLEDFHRQVRQAQLTQGVSQATPSKLHIPGR